MELGYEAGFTDEQKVIPLRKKDAERMALEAKLDEAFKAKEDAREALLKFPQSTEVLLAASTYAARLATYANLHFRLEQLEAK